MLKYNEALEVITEKLKKLKKTTESILITDSIGRILAEDIYSDVNLPPFDNSAMDGFAIQFSENIRQWEIIGEISAGNYQEYKIDSTKAIGIMTGAKVPMGADTIIPIEDCFIEENFLKVADDYNIKKGNHCRLIGEDLTKGIIAIKTGTLLRANHINLAAACGKSSLVVYRRINIGLLTTGDELIEVDKIPSEDQIRATNLSALICSIKQMNMVPIDFGIAKDNQKDIENKLKSALDYEIDLLVTTGGVSVGKYDFMQDSLYSIGADKQFWKVNIKPGKPLLFSLYKNGEKEIPILSLPGNPLSSFINFKLFVEQAIFLSYGVYQSNSFMAKLTHDIRKKDGRLHFILAHSEFDFINKCFTVSSAGSQSSGSMLTMSYSDCVFIIPEDLKELKSGEWVECIKI